LVQQGDDLLVADLGTDQVVVYRYDAATGVLARDDARTIAVVPGEGPRHLAFHPERPYLYLLNELAVTVMAYAREGESYRLLQTLSTLPKGFAGKGECAAVRISPDGRYLYATNRGCGRCGDLFHRAHNRPAHPAGATSTARGNSRGYEPFPGGELMVTANQHSEQSGQLFPQCRQRAGNLYRAPLRGAGTGLRDLCQTLTEFVAARLFPWEQAGRFLRCAGGERERGRKRKILVFPCGSGVKRI
jgi:6-phosphogluconolactonase (cycloisomerase 2 family)